MNALTRTMGLLTVVVVLASACRTATPSARAAPAAAQGCTLPPNAPAASAGFTEFANYSWTLFQALNWPVVTGQRGVPDCGRPIGSAGPTVWESYKTVDQIFLPNAVDPGPWNGGGAQAMRLTFRSKAPNQLPLESAIAQAVGGWLIDRQANPTYYQVGRQRDLVPIRPRQPLLRRERAEPRGAGSIRRRRARSEGSVADRAGRRDQPIPRGGGAGDDVRRQRTADRAVQERHGRTGGAAHRLQGAGLSAVDVGDLRARRQRT